MSQETTQPEPFGMSDEEFTWYRDRYRAAKAVGMTIRDAKLFASSNIAIGELHSLAKRGCPPDLLLRLLL